MLSQPFEFYGASVKLNDDQQIELADRANIRYYKMQVNELSLDKEALIGELEGTRRLTSSIKQ